MRKIYNAISLLLVIAGLTGGQLFAQGPLGLSWGEVGPNNKGGLTRAIAVDGSGNVWAGSVGGGLWKSTNGGATWSQVTGVGDNLAVSTIAVDGQNIYVGTGDLYYSNPAVTIANNWQPDDLINYAQGFFEYAGSPGEGVFVSNDGGNTWSHNNGTWNSNSTEYDDPFMSIQTLAAKNGRIFIGTLEGLYYSDNANLSTVTKVSGTNAIMNGLITDVVFGDGNTVFAATDDSAYISTNNGLNFGTGINGNVPTDPNPPNNRLGGDRIKFAVSPSSPSTVYVTGASDINGNCTGVFKSTDSGQNWVRIAPFESGTFQPFGGNGRSNLVLIVDPTDPNAFMIGGVRLYSYDDNNGLINAASHSLVPGFTTNYVPDPFYSIAYDPSNSQILYIGTEQEIVKSTDGGDTYTLKTKGYNASHPVGVSSAPNWKVLSSDRYAGLLYKANANSNPSFQQFNTIFTNGGIGRFSLVNFEYIITQNSDGGLERSLINGGAFETFYGFPAPFDTVSLGDDSIFVDRAGAASEGAGIYDAGGAPITPWAYDEVFAPADLQVDSLIQQTPVYLYMCTRNFVWLVTNPFGTLDSLPTWNRITKDLIASFAIPREYYTSIAVSGDNNHVVYVGTSTGKIFRIYNANDPLNFDFATQVVRVDTGSSMPGRWVTDIAFDPNDPNNVLVTYGGYDKSDANRVYLTNNALDQSNLPSFRPIGGNGLPDSVPVYSAAFHPNAGVNAMFVGTEEGFYSSTSAWQQQGSTISWNNETPPGIGEVPVYDIYIRPYYQAWYNNNQNWKYADDGTILIATHGRGIFSSRSVVAVDPQDIAGTGIDVTLFPNPSQDRTNLRFDLPASAKVSLEVFDIQGRKVETLAGVNFGAGMHDIRLNTSRLESGVYLVKSLIETSNGSYTKTHKLIVSR